MGHALAAWRMSGNTDLIVLGPIGGMHWPNVPREPHREVIVALAGVIANFIVMSLMVPALLLAEVNIVDILVHPFYPHQILTGAAGWIIAAKVAFG